MNYLFQFAILWQHYSFSCEFFARPKWRLKLMFDLWSAGVPRERKQPHLFDARKWYTDMCESLGGIINQGIKDGSFKQVDSKFAATVMIATLDGIMFQAALGLV